MNIEEIMSGDGRRYTKVRKDEILGCDYLEKLERSGYGITREPRRTTWREWAAVILVVMLATLAFVVLGYMLHCIVDGNCALAGAITTEGRVCIN